MFTPWYETDPDCCQHIRSDKSKYEMIQAVWLDMTEEDKSKGLHEYCIVRIEIDLNDYSDEEKEIYLSSYGYTLKSVTAEYGDDADSIVAECIMEEECLRDAYVIDDADSFEEAKDKIEKIIKEE